MEQPPVFRHLAKAENANMAAIAFLAFASILLVRAHGEIGAARRTARTHEFDLRKREASLDEREELLQEQAAKAQTKAKPAGEGQPARAPRRGARTQE